MAIYRICREAGLGLATINAMKGKRESHVKKQEINMIA